MDLASIPAPPPPGCACGAPRVRRTLADVQHTPNSDQEVQAYIDADCTMPVLRFVSPNLKEQLQRCIGEVLPAFRVGRPNPL